MTSFATSPAVAFAIGLAIIVVMGGAAAQVGQVVPPAIDAATIAPVPLGCETPGTQVITPSPLPNIAAALKARKKINILAIGTTSASLRGPVSGDRYAAVERFLETTFKGLDVEIVHRGVSGELAANAAERISTEAALTRADIVLWQVGTADAMAQIPVADFQASVVRSLEWLKQHNIDVILVGMRYTLSMSRDPHYQAMRQAIQEIAKSQNVLRVGLYEAEETLERIRLSQGVLLSDVEATNADYGCIAEYLARAIAVGIFARAPGQTGPTPVPAGKTP
jgi:acyl-CoA thioesterase I